MAVRFDLLTDYLLIEVCYNSPKYLHKSMKLRISNVCSVEISAFFSSHLKFSLS